MDIEIGGETFHKEANLLEQIAYRDTWGRGADSFIAMLYERLILMRDLLAETGSIYVHCDWRVNALLRLALSEVFGESSFRNEIIWKRKGGSANPQNRLGVVTDSIFWYSKSDPMNFEQLFTKDSDDAKQYIAERFNRIDETTGRRFMDSPVISPNPRPNLMYEYKGFASPPTGWSVSKDVMQRWDMEGRLLVPTDKTKRIRRKIFLDEYIGQPIQNLWTDVFVINSQAREALDYPTQKPEALLERIIAASSSEGDLVGDFFCGSGTTAAVAERLGRKWIATDLGKFGIHTTRKRLIGVQREKKAAEEDFRAFEVLNLGRYERQAYLNVGGRLTSTQKAQALAQKESEFRELILRAYKASGFGGNAGAQAQDGFFGRLLLPLNSD